MRLITFTVEGYRRFVDRTSIKLHADMVALIGPNEAGKSSLLRALTHLNSDGRFQPNEHPRRSDVKPHLKWQFQLDAEDREVLNAVPEAAAVHRIAISKGDDGIRRWSLYPEVFRSRATRTQAFDELRVAGGSFERSGLEVLASLDVDRILEVLDKPEEFGADDVREIEAFNGELGEVREALPEDESSARLTERILDVRAALHAVLEEEGRPHPADRARSALESRVPSFRQFEPADRNLEREYDLIDAADDPPPALRHLSEVAGLDLRALRDELAGNEIADASTRRNRANKALSDVFRSWNQEEIALQFEFQGTLLLVQATTPSDAGLSSIDDRSDGMRWFAALLAFIQGSENGPILLADEIETHLHYDAQADLIEVLARQSLISKVIYTTHSFGCLPFDLGNGVRVVQQTGLGTSALVNGFWTTGSGFSPLLASMGAAAVSFTPTRRAVVAEGATEAILLPTLLRQAASLGKLDFQIAPGLSSVASSDVANLETEAGQVAYLVDGDKGGLQIKQKLTRTVPEGRIVVLLDPENGGPMETEDLIDEATYLHAVNEELALWNPGLRPFAPKSLTKTMRTKALDTWCTRQSVASPDKAAVAQRVANRSAAEQVFQADRGALIVSLLGQLSSALAFTESPTSVS